MSPQVAVCREIQRAYGTSYFWATRLFPADLREATFVLYAFFRVADEIVDQGVGADRLRAQFGVARMTAGLPAAEALTAWEAAWHASANATPHDPVLAATRDLFTSFKIPEELARDFFAAMRQDLTVTRYPTYEALRAYMHGSAEVVGLMLTHVIGYEEGALPYAEALGEAMQLTNFLRDVGEDARLRNRVYVPQDDMARYGVTEEDILAGRMTPAFQMLMRDEIARADALYEFANQGIAKLHPRGRLAVRAAGDLYRRILRQIERRGFDVFSGRARTSSLEKIWCILTVSFPATRFL